MKESIYICDNVFIPIRTEPSHRAEQDSQILFGEKYSIIDHKDNWTKIKMLFDGQEGWIDAKHEPGTICLEESRPYTLNRRLLCCKEDNTSVFLEAGCDIYNPDFILKSFRINGETFRTENYFDETFVIPSETIVETAYKFLNTPYLWGGRSALGIDCSGLIQTIFKAHGISLPRNGSMQVNVGEEVSFASAQEGDVAFFGDEKGKVNHVGIMASKNRIIHASGKVRIDPIDQQGIYRHDMGRYSHQLKVIKRIS
ncbi:MAG: C40 family peptidase [Bacteroidales bacterium]|nr:C40 family peptidase [Bacteroidales bacterium]